jgi:hypothetical protein
MKKLATWGHHHKNAARTLIIISYIILNITGPFLGDILHSMDIVLTPLCIIAILLTLTGWMIYPSKSYKSLHKNFFVRQKSADFILISATFLFTIYAGNTLNNQETSFRNPVQAISIIHPDTYSLISENSEKVTLSKKSLRQKIRTEIKHIRKAYKESSKSQKTMYIILAALGALLLLYFVAGLSCSLACSGYEALGYVLFFGGLAGIIFGLVKVIQRITRGKAKI